MGQSGKQAGKIKLVKRSQLKSIIANLNSRAISRQVHRERSNQEVRYSPHHVDSSLNFNISPFSSPDRRESSQDLETNTSTLARLTHQEDNDHDNSNNTEGQPNVSHG